MLSLRSKAFKASVVHVDVRRVQETQVLGQEEGCSHIERHDSWMNQVCCMFRYDHAPERAAYHRDPRRAV